MIMEYKMCNTSDEIRKALHQVLTSELFTEGDKYVIIGLFLLTGMILVTNDIIARRDFSNLFPYIICPIVLFSIMAIILNLYK